MREVSLRGEVSVSPRTLSPTSVMEKAPVEEYLLHVKEKRGEVLSPPRGSLLRWLREGFRENPMFLLLPALLLLSLLFGFAFIWGYGEMP